MTGADFTELLEAYKKAAFERDAEAMMALYDDDIMAYDMWGNWSLDGIGAMRTMVEGWFGSLGDEKVIVEFDAPRTVAGNDVSAAQTILTFKALSPQGETLRSMQNRLSWVAARRNGAWKIVHQHTSSPIDPKDASVIWHRDA